MEARTTQEAREIKGRKRNAEEEALRYGGSGSDGEREAERREEGREG